MKPVYGQVGAQKPFLVKPVLCENWFCVKPVLGGQVGAQKPVWVKLVLCESCAWMFHNSRETSGAFDGIYTRQEQVSGLILVWVSWLRGEWRPEVHSLLNYTRNAHA